MATKFKGIKLDYSKEDYKEIKNFEKSILKLANLKEKYSQLIAKDKKHKDKLLIKGQAALEKNNIEKAKQIKLKHSQDLLLSKKEQLKTKIAELEKALNFDKLNKFLEQHNKGIIKQLESFTKQYSKYDIMAFKNNYLNDVNSLKLFYEIEEPLKIDKNPKMLIKQIHKEDKIENGSFFKQTINKIKNKE